MSKLTKRQRKEIEKLAERSEKEIDTGDIAEIADFTGTVRGRFYPPVEKQK